MINFDYKNSDIVRRVEQVVDATLILGDNLEIMKIMPDNSIDAVITDPPYGMNFVSNHRKIKHESIVNDKELPIEHIKESMRLANNCAYYFCRWDNIYEMPKPKSVLTWVKNNWSMGDLKHEHGRQWESCCFYAMQNHEFIKSIPDVIFENRTKNEYHPTQKPVNLMVKIIEANVANTILDPFMGSGTTGIAALKSNRKFIGVEIDEKHYETTLKRVRDFHNQQDLFSTINTPKETKKEMTEKQFKMF